jgi:Holliday junction DNA helicase RuvA
MARPVREIADAISRQDTRWLSTLPGIGATTAEQIITTLKRKVTKFAVSSTPSSDSQDAELKTGTKAGGKKKSTDETPSSAPEASAIDAQLIEDVYQTLMALGLTPLESRNKLDLLLQSGVPFKTVQDALGVIYSQGK